MASETDRLNIDSGTRLYAVMGDPITHSLSPVMHNAAFGQTGHNGVYVAFRVTDLPGAVTGIRALKIHGCSVTLPHKVAMFVHQGALQFERWTGKKAPIQLMRKTVLDTLTSRQGQSV